MLLAYCATEGVSISFLTSYGQFQARVEGPISGSILLRKAQYLHTNDPTLRLHYSRMFLLGKLHNQRSVIRRNLRDHRNTLSHRAIVVLKDFDSEVSAAIHRVKQSELRDINELYGLEGIMARAYFNCFPYLIRTSGFVFNARSRRPPLDPVNCLLSFIYTLLVRDICGAMECFGLDNQAGFLHTDRPGRPSLALDMLEEFRPCFADRLVLSMINRRQLLPKDFYTLDNGAVRLTDAARKQVLILYQNKKRGELKHPFTGTKEKFGNMWLVQSQLLARCLRGDLEAYPPFLWK